MVEPVRHRQTKGAATDMFGLPSPRHTSTLPSREHAVYALWDYGFRAAIAPSFGDIFYGNSFKNGFLPIVLPTGELLEQIKARAGTHIVVDLEQQLVIWPDGSGHRFEIDAFRKHCLLQGVDELGYTLERRADIDAFERDQVATTPWL